MPKSASNGRSDSPYPNRSTAKAVQWRARSRARRCATGSWRSRSRGSGRTGAPAMTVALDVHRARPDGDAQQIGVDGTSSWVVGVSRWNRRAACRADRSRRTRVESASRCTAWRRLALRPLRGSRLACPSAVALAALHRSPHATSACPTRRTARSGAKPRGAAPRSGRARIRRDGRAGRPAEAGGRAHPADR